jgi:DNA-binding response OmpR family regulator
VSGARKRPLVLAVDDQPDNVAILRMRLESQGYDVIEAGDGLAALEQVAAYLSDLVLLDIMMPRLGGIETVRRLRTNPALPFIPVVMLTAQSERKDVAAALDAGADEYLTKPIEGAALLARVHAMLRMKAPRRGARASSPACGLEPHAGAAGDRAAGRTDAHDLTQAVSRAADRRPGGQL